MHFTLKSSIYNPHNAYIGDINEDLMVFFRVERGLMGLRIVDGEVEVMHKREHVQAICNPPYKLVQELRKFQSSPESFDCDLEMNDFGVRKHEKLRQACLLAKED